MGLLPKWAGFTGRSGLDSQLRTHARLTLPEKAEENRLQNRKGRQFHSFRIAIPKDHGFNHIFLSRNRCICIY
jgi:hypothetical protein